MIKKKSIVLKHVSGKKYKRLFEGKKMYYINNGIMFKNKVLSFLFKNIRRKKLRFKKKKFQ